MSTCKRYLVHFEVGVQVCIQYQYVLWSNLVEGTFSLLVQTVLGNYCKLTNNMSSPLSEISEYV